MMIFLILVMLCTVSSGFAQGTLTTESTHIDSTYSGDYSGSAMSVLGTRYMIFLHLKVYANGYSRATYDIPEQQAYGLRFTNASLNHSKLQLVNDSADVTFDGLFNAMDGTISGVWLHQRSQSPLTLRRMASTLRSQQSASSYYVISQQVIINADGTDSQISGTLTVPDTVGTWPLFVFISDRGYQDQDALDQTGHRPFLVLARLFAQRGWASLRMDDRKTQAVVSPESRSQQADDIIAAINQISNYKHIDINNINIIGHGEGGLVGAIVSERNPGKIRSLVCAATPAVSGIQLLPEMITATERLYGTEEDVISIAAHLTRRCLEIAATVPDKASALKQIAEHSDSSKEIHEEVVDRYPMAGELMDTDRNEYITKSLYPWLMSYATLDPKPIIANITVPCLVLVAERDVQVPSSQNLDAWRKVAFNNSRSAVRLIIGVNHSFQPCEECTLEEASSNTVTIKDEVVDEILRWEKGN